MHPIIIDINTIIRDSGLALLSCVMSSKGVGMKTGGKGSWRRKMKKTGNQANQAADKLWLAAQRAGCRDIGQIDSCSMIIKGQEEALGFSKPELALDMRANTYLIRGKAEKKPMSEVFQDLIQGIDLSKFAKDEKKEEENLGDVDNVDFSKPAEEEKKE